MVAQNRKGEIRGMPTTRKMRALAKLSIATAVADLSVMHRIGRLEQLIVYFLERLEAVVGFVALEKVQRALERRLEAGRW